MAAKNLLHWPVTLAATLSAGMLLGATLFGNQNSGDSMALAMTRMREVLMYIRQDYVDTASVDRLAANAIEGMLSQLDPHSSYIPRESVEMANAHLEADFNGIGVEFVIMRDTVQIVAALDGGPSARAGLRAGDRIISVNGQTLSGQSLTTERVFRTLRGKAGSEVALAVLRPGLERPLDVTVKRNRIASRSVEAYFMLEPGVGYIRIGRFADRTDQEFRHALRYLKKSHLERLILDLRDNPGGYLEKAVEIADEFLPHGQPIASTKGRQSKYNLSYEATGRGIFERKPVVVLINEGSASAAEILAGALQDNDRATIIGRRSFGKGLVQMPIPLSDGSELRLTISRYYTPSGRCIQKPYRQGMLDDYDNELEGRYQHGELFTEDSLPAITDTTRYRTRAGRLVYGGGGIKPDIFVPFDSVTHNALLADLQGQYLIQTVASGYAERFKAVRRKMSLQQFGRAFRVPGTLIQELEARGRGMDIPWSDRQWANCQPQANVLLKAAIARHWYGENGYWYVMVTERDQILSTALEERQGPLTGVAHR